MNKYRSTRYGIYFVVEGDIYIKQKIKFSLITYCCLEFALKAVSFFQRA